MRRALLGLWVCSVLSLLGCGGEVRRSSSDRTAAQDTSTAGTPAEATPVDPFGTPDTTLGECVKGRVEGSEGAAVCPWVVDGYCYEDRNMACNCACPHDRNSQCVSGFDSGQHGHVPVDCF